MVNGPFLVVSDTHFGLEEETHVRFHNFLEWLSTAIEAHGTVPVQDVNEPNRSLKAPQTIALLGDILELWGPDRESFTESVEEALGAFETLSTLPGEKIYISGNHDHLTSGYHGTYELGNTTLNVFADHYPEDRSGVEIGSQRYFFLHGHQFDPVLKRRWVLKLLDFITVAAWNSHEASPWLGRVGFVFLVLALWFLTPLLSLIRGSPWSLAPVIFVVSGILMTLGVAWVWRQITKFWPLIHRLSPEPSASTQYAKYGATGSSRTPSDFPRYAEYQATRRGRTRGLGIQQLIDQGYYDKTQDTITAENVVLGHTHVPEITPKSYHGTTKRFINDGSWVSGEGHKHDTFAYIGDEGPLLLQWDDAHRTVHPLEEGAQS